MGCRDGIRPLKGLIVTGERFSLGMRGRSVAQEFWSTDEMIRPWDAVMDFVL